VSIWPNDDDLLASLKDAVREAEAVPPRFIELGKAVYDGRFTYTTTDLTVEIDITADAVLGRLLLLQPGTVSAYPAAGPIVTAPVDESGSFTIRPVPALPFRLRCVTASGLVISTGVIRASARPRR
jgi:hypothetical protein